MCASRDAHKIGVACASRSLYVGHMAAIPHSCYNGVAMSVEATIREKLLRTVEHNYRRANAYDEVFPHGAMEEMFHREPSIEKIGTAIGWTPTLTLDEILADVIAFAVSRPRRMTLNEILVRPTAQAG